MLNELINGCQTQDPGAQRRLFAHFAPLMMTTARRYAVDTAEAEDILQESFIKIFRAFHQFDPVRGGLEGWMRRIVANTAIRHWQRWHKNWHFVGEEALQTRPAEYHADAPMNAEVILARIAQLPSGCRMVFNLYAIEGYSHAEIGEMLGITESASRSQLSRARQHLQASELIREMA